MAKYLAMSSVKFFCVLEPAALKIAGV
ncbi:hypothetical protein NC652_006615 [Populus alba x Populus x berolinensis]|uniref:Uncharacterized protein n=1 Tax=Populus alba x Populus x berolinensis TaxID=444605 RepID=A0AAD6RF18_9ROSI|nr:hypothetical protein NC651_006408 [Populus alba x Populus x berolinensis]KAJ6955222.1 hypothetical protein NC652_006615 [Populus alba x Populus x berolinensis]KAJ7007532.1 hypothetical protein NC653_006543 [Populus alba x Populus x berolinensis]